MKEDTEEIAPEKASDGEDSDSDSDSDGEDMFLDEAPAEGVDGGDGNKTETKKMAEKRTELLDKLQSKIGNKDSYRDQTISVEYDEEAYIKTYGDRIKRIEFVGFDKVWERLHNLNKVLSLGLNDHRVSHLGPLGQMGQICANLDNLSLEHNLLCSWDQVFIIGHEAKKVTKLALSYNLLNLENENEINFDALKTYNKSQQTLNIPQELRPKVFQNLEHLILI
jgi:hypothetical protein